MSVIGTEPNFPKALNTTDGAHTKTMSTFESDEHLRGYCRSAQVKMRWTRLVLAAFHLG
jgi:hypothetical protein